MTIKEAKNEHAELCGKTLIAELEEKIERFARVSHYVLITGERGTGKTTLAKKLHARSARAGKEFVNLNCASLTQELLEAELFGYEKGAFTGATAPKAGLFEIASGGTIFLDEIGELPIGLQAKLLKAVEEKRIRRVGGSAEKTIDARVIAATSQNLKQMVAEGRFRADLYDRLNILNLETVPLRHQKDKIKTLLLERLNAEQFGVGRAEAFRITDKAVRVLENHDWRGNFRELLNFATRLAVECLDDAVITGEKARKVLDREQGSKSIADFNPAEQPDAEGQAVKTFDDFSMARDLVTVTFDPKFDDLDAIYLKAAGSVIRHIITEHNGNMRSAASTLGVNHSTISRILEKFNRTYDRKSFHVHGKMTTERAAVTNI
jgi:transcriptional regulator with PAS, ATPase and Fis domain